VLAQRCSWCSSWPSSSAEREHLVGRARAAEVKAEKAEAKAEKAAADARSEVAATTRSHAAALEQLRSEHRQQICSERNARTEQVGKLERLAGRLRADLERLNDKLSEREESEADLRLQMEGQLQQRDQEIVGLESKLEHASFELKSTSAMVEALQTAGDELQQSADEYASELRAAMTALAETEERLARQEHGNLAQSESNDRLEQAIAEVRRAADEAAAEGAAARGLAEIERERGDRLQRQLGATEEQLRSERERTARLTRDSDALADRIEEVVPRRFRRKL